MSCKQITSAIGDDSGKVGEKSVEDRSRKNSAQYSDDRDGECGDCLVNLGKVCIPTSDSSPRLNVWSAIEQVAARRTKRRKDAKSSLVKISADKCEPKSKSSTCLLVWGCLLCIMGAASLVWTPFDILMQERMRMMKGLPAYEWWQQPPDEVFLRAYVFNYTNAEEFLNGDADTLKVQEVGPYIFKEKLYHVNPVFHENGTMTYTAIREPIFLPEMNTLLTNATVIVPNMAVLASASFLADAPFITKWGFNMMVRQSGSSPFVKSEVWDYFWNFTDPLFGALASIAPALVPTKNAGILHTVYADFKDNVTVYTQPSNGDFNFFKMDQYNGSPRMNKYENATCDSIQGATEGVHYHQHVDRNDTIYYLRKTICRAVPLYYEQDMVVRGVKVYKFVLPNNTYDRPSIPEEECYRDPNYPLLPSGVTDVSPCYYNMPITSSFPHLMHASEAATHKLEGLNPSEEKHGSAAVIEPNTGIPLTAWARSQSNLYMHNVNSFTKLKRLSNMPLPMFWLEYKQEGLPSHIFYLLYFVVMVVKPLQLYFSLALITIGAAIYLAAFRRHWSSHFGAPAKTNYAPVLRFNMATMATSSATNS